MSQESGSGAAGERRSQWRFFTGGDGRWLWRRIPPQGRAMSSQGSFATLTECVADARANGYILWTLHERRLAA